ncbi:phosphoribosylglycinamide formyltransferase [Helicobacter bizzozeronii]|uniref:phosphoribosylglycinamide formyltransferase n=1 Tax=Helicobacter bizzozeronii TaxID=56877 RepID=UPI000CEE3082|nr:phosphoribosylglycinamide formyltransferase [Helicobacter bizzozeronii]
MGGKAHRVDFMDHLPSSLVHMGILFSGNGSNMQNLIEQLHQKPFWRISNRQPLILNVALCASNNPKAHGIVRCEKLGVPCVVVSSENELMQALVRCHVILLAGYMKILSPLFIQHYPTLNIHPSFLPHHKGKDAIKKSFESQEGMGVSVHWVTEELDGGPIILQESLTREPNDTLESFTQRVHALEHQLYPKALLKALGLRHA